MAEVAPRKTLAAYTRSEVADHDEWDGPHRFLSLHNVESQIMPGTYAYITPDHDTDDYPNMIAALAMRSLELPGLPPPCAFLLQHEAWMALLPEGAGAAEQAQLQRDAENRRIRERPDRVEIAVAMCADVHGRVYFATKRRDSGEVTEVFQAPFSSPGTQIGGRFTEALLAVAYSAGVACWDLPDPTKRTSN